MQKTAYEMRISDWSADGCSSIRVAGDKIARSPVQFADAPVLRKPSWIRVRIPSGNAVQKLKAKLRENRLVTVCEEASCLNIHECFGHGTATFMILGEVCTRRCSFCDELGRASCRERGWQY